MNNVFKHKKFFAELGLFYSAAIWGATFFIVKDALKDVDPVILVGYRFMIAALLLGGFCVMTRKPVFKNVAHGLLSGVVLWFLYISQTIGLSITTASNSGFITGLFVAFVPLFSLVIFRRAPMLTEIVATMVSLLGLWVLTEGLTDVNVGDLFTLIAAVTYAIHILLLDKYVKGGDDPYLLSFQQFLVVGAASFLIGAIFGIPLSAIGTKTSWVILFLALLPTLSAFVIQVLAQQSTKPLRVSLILAFEPVFAGLFAWTLGGEPIVLHRALGGLLIFLGMIISGIPPRAERARVTYLGTETIPS